MRKLSIAYSDQRWRSLYEPEQIDPSPVRQQIIQSLMTYPQLSEISLGLVDDYGQPYLHQFFPGTTYFLDSYFDFLDRYLDEETQIRDLIEIVSQSLDGEDEVEVEDDLDLTSLNLEQFRHEVDNGSDIYVFKFKPLTGKMRSVHRDTKQHSRQNTQLKDLELQNLDRLLKFSRSLEDHGSIDCLIAIPQGQGTSSFINQISVTREIWYIIVDWEPQLDYHLLVPQFKQVAPIIGVIDDISVNIVLLSIAPIPDPESLWQTLRDGLDDKAKYLFSSNYKSDQMVAAMRERISSFTFHHITDLEELAELLLNTQQE